MKYTIDIPEVTCCGDCPMETHDCGMTYCEIGGDWSDIGTSRPDDCPLEELDDRL